MDPWGDTIALKHLSVEDRIRHFKLVAIDLLNKKSVSVEDIIRVIDESVEKEMYEASQGFKEALEYFNKTNNL